MNSDERSEISKEIGVWSKESLGRLGDSEIGRIGETEDGGRKTEISREDLGDCGTKRHIDGK